MALSITWAGQIMILLVALLPVVGVVLLTLGIRGRATFSSPTCTKCGYDLRAANFMTDQPGACPECGADLSGAKAVSFGRYERSRNKIITGACLLLLPFVGYFVLRLAPRGGVAMAGPSAIPSQSTAQILAGLPAMADQPWSWRELENRLKTGKLNTAELDTALSVLLQDIQAKRATNASPQPLHWSNDFVKAAMASGTLSAQRKQELAEAFFAILLQVQTPKAVRAGKPMELAITAHAPWDLGGQVPIWALRDVKIGQRTLRVQRRDAAPVDIKLPSEELSGNNVGQYLELKALGLDEEGDQELLLVFDVGAVDQSTTLRGKDGRPGLKSQWPNPMTTWEVTVQKKIRVVPADQAAVQLATDPSHDPQRSTTSLVKQALVRKATGGIEVVVEWDTANRPCPPMAGHVKATAGDRPLDLGPLVWGTLNFNTVTRNWGGNPSRSTWKAASLPADVKSLSLTVIPDPLVAEQLLGLDTIWGKPIEIKDIPLQRFDIEAGQK